MVFAAELLIVVSERSFKRVEIECRMTNIEHRISKLGSQLDQLAFYISHLSSKWKHVWRTGATARRNLTDEGKI
jgi:hypothetical protein